MDERRWNHDYAHWQAAGLLPAAAQSLADLAVEIRARYMPPEFTAEQQEIVDAISDAMRAYITDPETTDD
jgi:hypothetical protein